MSLKKSITTRLLDFIAEHKLEDEQTLPSEQQMLADLQCESSEELSNALQTLESQGIIKRKENDWIVHRHIVIDENDGFSFAKYAQEHKQKLQTIVLEKIVRLPIFDDENPAQTEIEQKACKSLKLAIDEPFIVIARMRFLDGLPKVIHRAYLNPKQFAPDFLELHDFANESLVHIYRNNGYKLTTRNARLQARFAYLYDKVDFLKNLSREHEDFHHAYNDPILYVEQELFAEEKTTGEKVVLEFLHAAYVDLVYDILDRSVA